MGRWDLDHFFTTIEELVLCHSPSGVETEVNHYIQQWLDNIGVDHWQDEADNIVIKIPGETSEGAIAVTAHKDEIGALVKGIEADGRLQVSRLGGSYPWVYGEGVVDLLGDRETIPGILSFGSRHVSHESPQKLQQEGKAVSWETAWVETKLATSTLVQAGIRPGTRMVVGKHRKRPFRLGSHIASYTLDNKASVAILLGLAEQIKHPPVDVYLVASAKEEVGAVGALFFSQRQKLSRLIALEICPLSKEYPIADGPRPVLFSQDSYGLYDEGLNQEILAAGSAVGVSLQQAVVSQFGSDASIAMKFGHVPRGACLSFPTQNTHGYEIADLGAIANCLKVLTQYLNHGTQHQ
ncbi:M42 family metallopeptidase [Leptothoe kymatousa]|uniref:M42 family peptidase n=1 Tax=Leptothoe kymatousa TAU-MAC 1615 TaxID=2364775 RepID=A0ABS5XZH8_9CYAN|nr:M42 family peptidase [Leptothoe kymatousa]MBT9311000.1 M42 family peptidase [Leptothoe kymatousa TAU-MAC 1615]